MHREPRLQHVSRPLRGFKSRMLQGGGEVEEGEVARSDRKKDGEENEGRRMDSPVSHSLADRERITMRSLPLLFLSVHLSSSFCPTARSLVRCFVRPSVCLPVCLSIRSSPRLPPVTLLASLPTALASGIHLFSCPVLPCPPALLLLFLPFPRAAL